MLIFPDFELVHLRDPAQRWLVELVGYWTRSHLDTKLRRLRAAGMERMILCIDTKQGCGDDELPEHASIVRYRSRIDAQAVLSAIAGDYSAARHRGSHEIDSIARRS